VDKKKTKKGGGKTTSQTNMTYRQKKASSLHTRKMGMFGKIQFVFNALFCTKHKVCCLPKSDLSGSIFFDLLARFIATKGT